MKCPKCGSEKINEEVEDTMDAWGSPLVCEISYNCADCGEGVNYWAYGSYQDASNV